MCEAVSVRAMLRQIKMRQRPQSDLKSVLEGLEIKTDWFHFNHSLCLQRSDFITARKKKRNKNDIDSDVFLMVTSVSLTDNRWQNICRLSLSYVSVNVGQHAGVMTSDRTCEYFLKCCSSLTQVTIWLNNCYLFHRYTWPGGSPQFDFFSGACCCFMWTSFRLWLQLMIMIITNKSLDYSHHLLQINVRQSC